jgi:hypothetical protein
MRDAARTNEFEETIFPALYTTLRMHTEILSFGHVDP